MPRKPALTLTWRGETKTYIDWSLSTGIPMDAIRQRIKKGWDIEEALTTPHSVRRKNKSIESVGRWAKTRRNG